MAALTAGLVDVLAENCDGSAFGMLTVAGVVMTLVVVAGRGTGVGLGIFAWAWESLGNGTAGARGLFACLLRALVGIISLLGKRFDIVDEMMTVLDNVRGSR